MNEAVKRGLFEAYGIELEYVIVDRDQLSVRSSADRVLQSLNSGSINANTSTNEFPSDSSSGLCTWSNELAMHVIELKITDPIPNLVRLPTQFENAVRAIDPVLEQHGLRLLPTSMHPWMNPARETKLWPHECHEIYEQYHKIFNCYSHGWANVQSVHLNLPFNGDEQFAKLHAAVRLVLPLLPALAASSPIVNSQISGWHSTRMKMYMSHCDRVPELMGPVIPEPFYDEASYRREIFGPIAKAIQPFDPERTMECDFLNARGAIARFDRGSVEIRVMDVQEYPAADVSICAAVVAVLRALTQEKWSSLESQKQMPTERLKTLLTDCSVTAENSVIEDQEFLRHFGVTAPSIRCGDLWQHLVQTLRSEDSALDSLMAPLKIILDHGTLSTRILNLVGDSFSHEELHDAYDQVADCLQQWQPLMP
ncbi:glutamate-cysteine ligase family protein [Novipirellula rosea]|uniref:Glutamate-cysteine ligase family protein n=1 Tax=Novipirellula rosea TaxID=1031540 RepID=A0ABP8N7T6_9BACT